MRAFLLRELNVYFFELNPFDFEEFLWAMGEHAMATVIRSQFESLKPLPDNLHRKASSSPTAPQESARVTKSPVSAM